MIKDALFSKYHVCVSAELNLRTGTTYVSFVCFALSWNSESTEVGGTYFDKTHSMYFKVTETDDKMKHDHLILLYICAIILPIGTYY